MKIKVADLVLSLALFTVLISCTGDPGKLPASAAVIDMSREPSEVLLPQTLWDEIEQVHIGLHSQNFDPNRELVGPGLVKFYASLPLTVDLTSSHSATLKETAYRLVFPDGGGTLDLGRFIKSPATGSLNLKFNFPDDFASQPKKVFFLSHSPRREIGGKSMGSSCNTFMDVTSYFEKSMKGDGLELFLKDDRHLTVFGGTFFLVSTRASQLFLAHLKIHDSRHPELFCPKGDESV